MTTPEVTPTSAPTPTVQTPQTPVVAKTGLSGTKKLILAIIAGVILLALILASISGFSDTEKLKGMIYKIDSQTEQLKNGKEKTTTEADFKTIKSILEETPNSSSSAKIPR